MKGLSHKERAERRKAIALHAEKHGVSEAARKFGVGLVTVRYSLRENGKVATTDRPSSKPAVRTIAILKAILVDGMNDTRAGEILGVSHQRVWQVRSAAIAAGFKVKRHGRAVR